ncbi:MAG: CPBP family intramembrane metalloprotease [Desulfamplus sp.]|nr:CPBP family intramembrane metalloprotease [Desulfamplus sp.]
MKHQIQERRPSPSLLLKILAFILAVETILPFAIKHFLGGSVSNIAIILSLRCIEITGMFMIMAGTSRDKKSAPKKDGKSTTQNFDGKSTTQNFDGKSATQNFDGKSATQIFNYSYWGFSKHRIPWGIKWGFLCSLCFGLLVILSSVLVFLITGTNPLDYIDVTMPQARSQIYLFIITGAIIAPAAEEIFFRGIIYSFCRRYGIFAAVVISTALFALCHFDGHNIPIIQTAGGIIFAVSFEASKSIAAPMIIHVMGNLTIFLITAIP